MTVGEFLSSEIVTDSKLQQSSSTSSLDIVIDSNKSEKFNNGVLATMAKGSKMSEETQYGNLAATYEIIRTTIATGNLQTTEYCESYFITSRSFFNSFQRIVQGSRY